MADCHPINILHKSKEYEKFEVQLNVLLQCLEVLQGQEIYNALNLVRNIVFAKNCSFDDNCVKKQVEIPRQKDYSSHIENKNAIDSSNLLTSRNFLWDKGITDSSSISYNVIPLESTLSYSLHGSPTAYCQDTYLDLSQRDKITFEFEKENENSHRNNDGEVILNLCSKSKTNTCDYDKFSRKETISSEQLESDVLASPITFQYHVKGVELTSETGTTYSNNSSLHSCLKQSKLKSSDCENNKESDDRNVLLNHQILSSSLQSSCPGVIQCANSFKLNIYDHSDSKDISLPFEPISFSSTETNINTYNKGYSTLFLDTKSTLTSKATSAFKNFNSYENKSLLIHGATLLTHKVNDDFDLYNNKCDKHNVFNFNKTLGLFELPENAQGEKSLKDEILLVEDSSNAVTNLVQHKSEGALNLVNKNLKQESFCSISSTSNDDSSNLTDRPNQNSDGPSSEISYNIKYTTEDASIIGNKDDFVPVFEIENKSNCPISCKNCHALISDVSLWKDHISECTKKLFCQQCNISFNSKTTYMKHLSSHERNSCKMCQKTFRSRKLLEVHRRTEHQISGNLGSKVYRCEFCDHVRKKRISLYHHLKSHTLPNQKVCQTCGKFIDGEIAYQSHIEEHYQNANLKCNLCDAIFSRRQNYNDHIKGHNINGCKYCEKSFSNKKSLFKHCKTDHPTLPQIVSLNKSYKCDKCTKIFIRPSLLRDHKITHSDPNSFICQLCNIRFAGRRALLKHLKTSLHKYTSIGDKFESTNPVDGTKDIFACEHCGIIFPSMKVLAKHTFRLHDTKPTLKCLYCDYKTKKKIFMKRHTDTHLGCEIKKFICDKCGSSFVSLTSLKEHSSFVHSEERPFKCSICEKCFKNNSCLLRHKKTHNKERPFRCDCGASYKILPHLVRHLSTVHSKKVKSRRLKRVNEEEQDSPSDSIELNNPSPVLSTTLEWSSGGAHVKSLCKETNDLLISSSEAILMNDDGSIEDSAPLYTVLDSQFIHLMPPSLNLSNEVFQTVSLINGELHTISISPPFVNNNDSNGSFVANCEESLLMHPTHDISQNSLSLNTQHTSTSSEIAPSINCIEMDIIPTVSLTKIEGQKDGLHISELGNTLHLSSSSLASLHFESAEESLQSDNYLNKQTSRENQEIVQNVSIF